jgi:protein archease
MKAGKPPTTHVTPHLAFEDGQAVDLSAGTLDGVFETAARALAEATVDPATVPESIARYVALEAPTVEHLLFDWLSELVYIKEMNAEVYVRTNVQVTGRGPCRLSARLFGGHIVPGRTEKRADVKGVARREFVLEPCPRGWHARFIVDL